MIYHKAHNGASTVAHNWANELTVNYKKDHTAGSLFFEGRIIYSYGYHFPIATICVGKNGKKAVLFTTRGYSNTTARHIAVVRQACSQYELIYCQDPKAAMSGTHTGNLQAFEQVAKANLIPLAKAKKPELYLNDIAAQKELATKYAEFFGIEKSKEFKALNYIHIVTKEGGKVASEKDERARVKADKERQERLAAQHVIDLAKEAEQIKKFRAFKNGYERVWSNASGFSYLRFNKETNRVETSQKVEIPVKIAERAFKWVLATIKAGGCDGECGYKILDFEVREVTAQQVRIGCHLLSIGEINKLAKQLKW